MDLLYRPNSISGFRHSLLVTDYTVIDHVISHVACFSILIVSKRASSSASTSSDYPAELSSTTFPSFGDQQ